MSVTIEQFNDFYKEYEQECRNKNAEFLKNMIPEDIEDDHLAFIVGMSYESVMALDQSGVKPKITQSDNHFDVEYEGDLGDGMTYIKMGFCFSDGRWLVDNPDDMG